MSLRVIGIHAPRLLATAFAAVALFANLHAATLVVTSTADDGSPGTLRAELAAANDGDVIDATNLTGTITLLTQFLTSSQLAVTKSVSIVGPGPKLLTIDGNQTSRVFRIFPGLEVTIDGFTIANGRASNAPPGSFPANNGGGIYNDHSHLTLNNCFVSENSAFDTVSFSGSGGGVYNDGGDSGAASLVATKSEIRGNSADTGGGIVNFASGTGIATLEVEDSTINGNTAGSAGGVGNIVESGSGDTASATTAIMASTLSGNSAQSEGGAIINERGALILSGSTISSNSSVGRYAGLYNLGGIARVSSCTFSGNSGDSTQLGGAIISGSGSTVEIGNTILRAGAIGRNLRRVATSARIISHGFNLCSDDGEGDLTAAGDRINTDPLLGPLADNGGPTLTHLPLLGSPALDQGTSDGLTAFGITTDQRGLARTVDDPLIPNAFLGDGTDVGAVEVEAAPPPPPPSPVADVAVTFLGVDKVSVKQGEVLTYTIAVRNVGPDTAPNVVISDLMSSGTGFLSARATKGSFSTPPVNQTGMVTWTLGDMANGGAEGAELVVSVLVKGKTTVTNLVVVSSEAEDPDPENNVASVTTSVAASSGGKKK